MRSANHTHILGPAEKLIHKLETSIDKVCNNTFRLNNKARPVFGHFRDNTKTNGQDYNSLKYKIIIRHAVRPTTQLLQSSFLLCSVCEGRLEQETSR